MRDLPAGPTVSLVRRVAGLVLAAAAAGSVSMLTAQGGAADTSTITPDRQLYATQGPDPYMDQDLHVAIGAGQPQAWSYVHFNLGALPRGANVQALSMKLLPNANAQQNQDISQTPEDLQACLLPQPIPATYSASSPPAYDCSKVHSEAQLQADGSWTVDLMPLVQAWNTIGNTGLALVGVPSSTSDVPPQAGLAEDTWTLGFDHTKTAGSVDYTATAVFAPPPASASSGSAQPAVIAPPPIPAPAFVPPAQPSGAATPAATASAAPAPAPAARATPSTSAASGPRVSTPWIWVLVAVMGMALVVLVGGALPQLSTASRITLGTVGRALTSSRSRLATQLAVLGLTAVVAAGYTGQVASSAAAAGGGAGQAGATADAGGGGANGPGSSGSGAGSAGGAAGSSTGSSGAAGGQATGGGNGGAAGGAAGGGANGAAGSFAPGVTPSTITIGMSYLTDANNANATYGAQSSANDYGNTQQEAQAVVDWVNKHGKVAGRNLVIHWQPVSNAEALSNPSGYLQQVCDTYTQDYHVFAVVDFVNNVQAKDCYAQNHTLLLDESPEQGDFRYYRLMQPYVLSPSSMGSDRETKTKIAGLQQMGFYSSVSSDQATLKQPFRLGVLVVENPVEQDIYNNVTLPQLARLGIPSNQVEAYQIREDSTQNEETDVQSAVVKFEQDGVNHVITQGSPGGGEGGMTLFFAEGAYKQQYHPLYGLGSTDAPGALDTLPGFQTQLSDQLKNAVGVGWNEGADVSAGYGAPWPPTSGPEKQCMDIEYSDGVAHFSNRTAAGVAMEDCDAILLLQQAAAGLTDNLTGPNLFNAAMGLGSRYVSASAYASSLGGDHFDGPAAYRLLYEDPNCNVNGSTTFCFRFKSTTNYAAASMSSSEP